MLPATIELDDSPSVVMRNFCCNGTGSGAKEKATRTQNQPCRPIRRSCRLVGVKTFTRECAATLLTMAMRPIGRPSEGPPQECVNTGRPKRSRTAGANPFGRAPTLRIATSRADTPGATPGRLAQHCIVSVGLHLCVNAGLPARSCTAGVHHRYTPLVTPRVSPR